MIGVVLRVRAGIGRRKERKKRGRTMNKQDLVNFVKGFIAGTSAAIILIISFIALIHSSFEVLVGVVVCLIGGIFGYGNVLMEKELKENRKE
jgi:hypothetical protein